MGEIEQLKLEIAGLRNQIRLIAQMVGISESQLTAAASVGAVLEWIESEAENKKK